MRMPSTEERILLDTLIHGLQREATEHLDTVRYARDGAMRRAAWAEYQYLCRRIAMYQAIGCATSGC